MLPSIRRNGVVAVLSCVVAIAALSGSEPIPQGIAPRQATTTEETSAAGLKANPGVAAPRVYGLPFDFSPEAVPSGLALGDVSPYLSELYRALWGTEYKNRRGSPRGDDPKKDERQRFLEEYRDALATPGD